MATKDWKLLSTHAGRHGNIIEYMNKKNGQFITIVNYGAIGTAMFHRAGKEELDFDKIILEMSFKNNKQALWYVKRYIKYH